VLQKENHSTFIFGTFFLLWATFRLWLKLPVVSWQLAGKLRSGPRRLLADSWR